MVWDEDTCPRFGWHDGRRQPGVFERLTAVLAKGSDASFNGLQLSTKSIAAVVNFFGPVTFFGPSKGL